MQQESRKSERERDCNRGMMQESEWESVFRTRAQSLQDLWTFCVDDSIQPGNTKPGFYEYIRGSFAEFRCSGCRHFWSSKRVLVVFHFTRDAASGRGSVKVRRCKQECRRCKSSLNENPSFSRENIDVLVEKLIEKIKYRCYGMSVGETARRSQFVGKVAGPHESSHCEACKLGICQQGI